MNRREFLGAMAAAPIAIRGVAARGTASRTFEITTKISLEESHDAGVAWVPLPLARAARIRSIAVTPLAATPTRPASRSSLVLAPQFSSPSGGT